MARKEENFFIMKEMSTAEVLHPTTLLVARYCVAKAEKIKSKDKFL